MKRYINKTAFAKTEFDSSTVGMLSFIAHPIAKAGNYIGSIYDGKRLLDRFRLIASEKEENIQVDIDLANYNFRDLSGKNRKAYSVQSGGYVMFYDSKNDRPCRVTLERVNENTKKPTKVFDTQKLSKRDLFIVSLIRPGKYIASDDGSRTMNVEVPYPDKKVFTERDTVLNPVTLKLTPEGFEKKEVRLLPSQGLVFQVENPSSVKIRLKEEYNQPSRKEVFDTLNLRSKQKKKIRRKYHWENPKYYQR